MRKYVVYLRVSTAEQGKSGLGLEAQQRDIELFLNGYSEVPWEVVDTFQDVASGAEDDRPELAKAISLAKSTGAELLVAKLDRLSRRMSFVASLLETPRLKVRVACMPHAEKFQLHIYAALAEQERDFISTRTKAALAAAKARGVKLGGDRHGALQKANAVRDEAATVEALRMHQLIEPMRTGGASLAAIAATLNRTGFQGWSPEKVRRAIKRVADHEAQLAAGFVPSAELALRRSDNQEIEG